jgi:mannose-6-phosphate isomerase-like protein (cupin superfamily)
LIKELTMAEATTVIIASTTAPTLTDGVIAYESVKAEGDAPGAAAYVHYNGPTDQLATMCTGMCVLDPGASPHPPHQHPEEEFMIVASGTGVIEVDGKPTAVGPGAIMYCGASVLHGITNTGVTPMTFYWSKWIAKGFE